MTNKEQKRLEYIESLSAGVNAIDAISKAYNPVTYDLPTTSEGLKEQEQSSGSSAEGVSFGQKFLDSLANQWHQNGIVSAIESSLGRLNISKLLTDAEYRNDYARWSDNRQFGDVEAWKPSTEEMEELEETFKNNEERKKAILQYAFNDDSFQELVRMHKEHQALEDRVNARPIGMYSSGAVVGAVLDPINIVSVPTTGGMSVAVNIGKVASRLGMANVAKIGTSKVASIIATGAEQGLFNTVDGYVSEKAGGYEQNHLANFLIGGAIGSTLSTVGVLVKHFGEKGRALNSVANGLEQDLDNVIIKASGGEPFEATWLTADKFPENIKQFMVDNDAKTLGDAFHKLKDKNFDDVKDVHAEMKDFVESQVGKVMTHDEYLSYVNDPKFNSRFYEDRIAHVREDQVYADIISLSYGEELKGMSIEQIRRLMRDGDTTVFKPSASLKVLEEELVGRARKGDRQAFNDLYILKGQDPTEMYKTLTHRKIQQLKYHQGKLKEVKKQKVALEKLTKKAQKELDSVYNARIKEIEKAKLEGQKELDKLNALHEKKIARTQGQMDKVYELLNAIGSEAERNKLKAHIDTYKGALDNIITDHSQQVQKVKDWLDNIDAIKAQADLKYAKGLEEFSKTDEFANLDKLIDEYDNRILKGTQELAEYKKLYKKMMKEARKQAKEYIDKLDLDVSVEDFMEKEILKKSYIEPTYTYGLSDEEFKKTMGYERSTWRKLWEPVAKKLTTNRFTGNLYDFMYYGGKDCPTLARVAQEELKDPRGDLSRAVRDGSVEQTKKVIKTTHYAPVLEDYNNCVNRFKGDKNDFNDLVHEAWCQKYMLGNQNIKDMYDEAVCDAVDVMKRFRDTDALLTTRHKLLDLEKVENPNEWYRIVDQVKLKGLTDRFGKEEMYKIISDYLDMYVPSDLEKRAFRIKEYARDIINIDEPFETTVSKDFTPSHLKKRLPMDINGEMILPDGTTFTWAKDICDHHIFNHMLLVSDKDSGFIAGKMKYGDVTKHIKDRDKQLKSELQKAVNDGKLSKAKATRYLDTYHYLMLRQYRINLDEMGHGHKIDSMERIFNGLSTLSYMYNGTNMGLNQLGETAGSVGINGFKGLGHYFPFNDLMKEMDNPYVRKEMCARFRLECQCKDLMEYIRDDPSIKSSRQRLLLNDGYVSRKAGTVEDLLDRGTTVTSKLNGLSLLTRYGINDIQNCLVADSILYVNKAFKGKLNAHLFDTDNFSRYGLNREEVMGAFRKYFGHINQDSPDDALVKAWNKWVKEEPTTFYKYYQWLNDTTDTAVLTETLGGKPLMSLSPLLRTILQFKSFSIRGLEGHLFRVLDHGTRDDLASFVSSLITNMAVCYVRKALTGITLYGYSDKTQEWIENECSPIKMFNMAMWRTSHMAFPSVGRDFYEMYTGKASYRTTVNRRVDQHYNPSNPTGKAGFIASNFIQQTPVLGTLDALTNVASYGYDAITGEPISQQSARRAVRGIPWTNHLLLQVIFAQLADMMSTDNKER